MKRMSDRPHIAVCICTFRRPDLLRSLLQSLQHQVTNDAFDYSIVVVDNDASESARPVAESAGREGRVPIVYRVQPEQNIALARNTAVAHAHGDYVAFIDDDEIAEDVWLSRLLGALTTYGAAGVLGPMKVLFDPTPPAWMIKSCFTRPSHPTGFVLDWKHQATGNVLVKRRTLDAVEGPFRIEFGRGGEDVDFFRRAMEAGHVFVWCEEAVVHEVIAPARATLSFQLKRALLRGKATAAGPAGSGLGLLKSAVACAAYTALLPLCLIRGRATFVTYLIKDFDHLGKLLAAFGVDVIKENYVSVRSADTAAAAARR